MTTYRLIRYFEEGKEEFGRVVVRTGLDLNTVEAHCNGPDASSKTAQGRDERARTEQLGPWHDCYEKEGE